MQISIFEGKQDDKTVSFHHAMFNIWKIVYKNA